MKIWVLCWLLAMPAAAEVFGDLEGDRPDFTESALVVPPGVFQVEGGLTWERTARANNAFQALELSLRYGTAERFEWRLGLPNYQQNLVGPERVDGATNPLVGFKYQVGPLKTGTDLSVIVQLAVPTGSREVASNSLDPEVKVPFSHPLGGPWALNGQASFFVPRVEDGRDFNYQQTLSIARDLSDRAATFVEWVGDFSQDAADFQQLHPGFTYRVAANLKLDVHAAFGLTDAAPDFLVGTGFVWRP